MKKTLFIILAFFLLTVSINAQQVVTDPTNNIVLLQQLTEATNQTKQVSQSANYLKQSCDFLTKVNRKIQDAAFAKNVLTQQVSLITKASKMLTKKNVSSLSNYQSLCNHVETILSKNRALAQLLTQTLSPSMKMSDSERLNMLMSIEEKTQQLNRSLSNMESTFNISNSMLKLVK